MIRGRAVVEIRLVDSLGGGGSFFFCEFIQGDEMRWRSMRAPHTKLCWVHPLVWCQPGCRRLGNVTISRGVSESRQMSL